MKKKPARAYDASTLYRALEERHRGDFVVAECKDGATTTRRHLQLDAWVLSKTWSPVTTIGYEIKVSRGDFLRDEKMAGYLPLCHLLYVVTPKGLLSPDELPDKVGLLEALGGSEQNPIPKLAIRKRASRRDIELPVNLMLYVLMYRAIATDSTYGSRLAEPGARWRAAVANRHDLGYQVKRAIRERWQELERRAADAEAKVKTYDGVREHMRAMGLDPDKAIPSYHLADRVRAALSPLTPEVTSSVNYAITNLQRVQQVWLDLQARATGASV